MRQLAGSLVAVILTGSFLPVGAHASAVLQALGARHARRQSALRPSILLGRHALAQAGPWKRHHE